MYDICKLFTFFLKHNRPLIVINSYYDFLLQQGVVYQSHVLLCLIYSNVNKKNTKFRELIFILLNTPCIKPHAYKEPDG